MSRRPWYKRYGGDVVLGTMDLTLEEKGAYSICLDLIYDRGGPIPDDRRWLAGVCGVSVRKWGAIRDRLIEAGKLEVRDGRLANRRADREIAEAADQSAIRAENGAKGGRKRAENVAKPEDKFGESDTATRENNNLAQARLKPNQKPEPENTPPTPPEGGEPINLRPFAKLLRIVATSGMTFDQAVQAAWAVQPIVDGRRRSTRADVHRAFVGVLRRGAMPAEALAGLRAYYALPASTKDGGQFASGAAVILNRDRWREFLPAPEVPPAPVSAAVEAHRLAHWRRTGEWKREWGERPREAA